jgi:hypothetical protein
MGSYSREVKQYGIKNSGLGHANRHLPDVIALFATGLGRTVLVSAY